MNKKIVRTIYLLALIAIPSLLLACVEAHPSYEVTSLKMTPTKIATGEKVTIEVEVKNTNSETDTYNVPLMVNGVADSRKKITLAPGQTELLTFELTRSHAGSYKISVSDKESTLTVENPSPAVWQLSNLQITPDRADVCESVAITAKLANVGGNKGSYTAELKIDGVINQTQKVTVASSANCMLCFKVSKGLPGTYKVSLGTLSGEFIVKEPAAPVFNIPIAPPCPPSTEGSGGYGC
jgi:hypothetical protein